MGGQSSTRQRAQGSGRVLSRRNIVKGAVGAAAVGAGGAVLTTATASPASAAAQATTIESGAVAPAVVNLTDAATIAVDASLGNDFRVTIAGNRTMGNPANPANGQQIIFQVTQGSGGSFTLSWGSSLRVLLRAAAAQPQHHRRADGPARLHLQRGQGRLAAGRVRERIRLMGTYRLFPSTDGPSSPGLVHRQLPGRGPVLRHQ